MFKNGQSPEFKVEKGDLLKYDWSDADFVLANSTCFEQSFMVQIASEASKMKVGAWMITLTKKLPSADPNYIKEEEKREWECLSSIKLEMSWGPATVNVQRKVK